MPALRCRTSVIGWILFLLVGFVAIRSIAAGDAEGPRIGEDVILAALEEKTVVEFIDEPLSSVVEFWEKCHNVAFHFDERALKSKGKRWGPDLPVSMQLDNITLRSALNRVLEDLELAWTIGDKGLVITTPEEAKKCFTVRTYDVGDFVATQAPRATTSSTSPR